MKKRIFATLLAVVLVISMVGCANGEESSKSNNSVKESTSKTELETTGSVMEGEIETASLLPYTGEEVTFKFFWFDTGTEFNEELPVPKVMQEMLGNIKLDLEILPLSDYMTKLPLLMAGGELADITIIYDTYNFLSTYGPNGVFLDWAPLMEEYMPNVSRYASEMNMYNTLKDAEGHLYALPSELVSGDKIQMNWSCNRTLLDSLGIKVPETRDEFLEACRQVKEKTGITPIQIDGKLDVVAKYMSQMYKNAGWELSYFPEEGKWDYAPTRADSEFKDLMEFMNILWEEELISHDVNTRTRDQVTDYFESGEFAFTFDYNNIYSDKPDDDIEIAEYDAALFHTPVGTAAQQIVTTAMDGSAGWAITANAETEHPELLAAVVDLMFSDQVSKLYNFGIEGISYDLDEDGEPYFLDNMRLASTRYAGDMTLNALGNTRHPLLRAISVEDIDAYYLSWEIPEITEGRKKIESMLDSGELTAKYTYEYPTLTEDESNEVADIKTPVDTYMKECMYKFIMGDMDIDTEWDTFMAELQGYGDIDRACEILNSKEMYQFKGKWR